MVATKLILSDDNYIFDCPNCGNMIIVHKNDINCGIFRHGQFRKDGSLINPHASKEYCLDIVKKKLIYGCGKPFQLIHINREYIMVEKCDYI
jgi:hypothetical protein